MVDPVAVGNEVQSYLFSNEPVNACPKNYSDSLEGLVSNNQSMTRPTDMRLHPGGRNGSTKQPEHQTLVGSVSRTLQKYRDGWNTGVSKQLACVDQPSLTNTVPVTTSSINTGSASDTPCQFESRMQGHLVPNCGGFKVIGRGSLTQPQVTTRGVCTSHTAISKAGTDSISVSVSEPVSSQASTVSPTAGVSYRSPRGYISVGSNGAPYLCPAYVLNPVSPPSPALRRFHQQQRRHYHDPFGSMKQKIMFSDATSSTIDPTPLLQSEYASHINKNTEIPRPVSRKLFPNNLFGLFSTSSVDSKNKGVNQPNDLSAATLRSDSNTKEKFTAKFCVSSLGLELSPHTKVAKMSMDNG